MKKHLILFFVLSSVAVAQYSVSYVSPQYGPGWFTLGRGGLGLGASRFNVAYTAPNVYLKFDTLAAVLRIQNALAQTKVTTRLDTAAFWIGDGEQNWSGTTITHADWKVRIDADSGHIITKGNISSDGRIYTKIGFDSIAFQSWKHDTLDADKDFVLLATTAATNDTLHLLAANTYDGQRITFKKTTFNTGTVTLWCEGALIDHGRDITLASYRQTATIVRRNSTNWYIESSL